MNTPHVFKPGYTGFSCEQMYLDNEGHGEVCGRKALDVIHIPDGELPHVDEGQIRADDMIPRPDDHKVAVVKRFNWLPAWKWNLMPIMVSDRAEGDETL